MKPMKPRFLWIVRLHADEGEEDEEWEAPYYFATERAANAFARRASGFFLDRPEVYVGQWKAPLLTSAEAAYDILKWEMGKTT